MYKNSIVIRHKITVNVILTGARRDAHLKNQVITPMVGTVRGLSVKKQGLYKFVRRSTLVPMAIILAIGQEKYRVVT
jgi:hypothetical protein